MIKFEKLKAGETYYERRREGMGNTTLRTLGEWPVKILSIDAGARVAIVSWNGNSPKRWTERMLRSLYDWSMYDKDVAEITRGICNSVVKVTKKKPIKTVLR